MSPWHLRWRLDWGDRLIQLAPPGQQPIVLVADRLVLAIVRYVSDISKFRKFYLFAQHSAAVKRPLAERRPSAKLCRAYSFWCKINNIYSSIDSILCLNSSFNDQIWQK